MPVDVRNYHHFARGYLTSRNKLPWNSICSPADRLRFIEAALDSAGIAGIQNAILNRPREFFDEEFKWIQGHGIGNLQDYVEVKRKGRSSGLKRADRPIVFDVYKRYLRLREQGGKLYDWGDLASAVLSELRKDRRDRLYRHVVIDEGQDFSPEMLRSLAAAIPAEGSLTFFWRHCSTDLRPSDVVAKRRTEAPTNLEIQGQLPQHPADSPSRTVASGDAPLP